MTIAMMKTELITEVMPELLESMINEAHQHHLKLGQYSDSASIQDFIELHYRDEIIANIRKRVNWESWLVIEISAMKLPQEPMKIAEYVRTCIDDSIWYESFEGGTFSASEYIEYQCQLLGYTGEPVDSPLESDVAERCEDMRRAVS